MNMHEFYAQGCSLWVADLTQPKGEEFARPLPILYQSCKQRKVLVPLNCQSGTSHCIYIYIHTQCTHSICGSRVFIADLFCEWFWQQEEQAPSCSPA